MSAVSNLINRHTFIEYHRQKGFFPDSLTASVTEFRTEETLLEDAIGTLRLEFRANEDFFVNLLRFTLYSVKSN